MHYYIKYAALYSIYTAQPEKYLGEDTHCEIWKCILKIILQYSKRTKTCFPLKFIINKEYCIQISSQKVKLNIIHPEQATI